MPNVYRTARGEVVDIDILKLANESVIAIGNMKTNARGDQLGSGGKIVKTRAQVMQEYHQLHTPVADNSLPEFLNAKKEPLVENQIIDDNLATPAAQDMISENDAIDYETNANETETTNYTKPRGSFADAVAKQTEAKQPPKNPIAEKRVAQKKVQRI